MTHVYCLRLRIIRSLFSNPSQKMTAKKHVKIWAGSNWRVLQREIIAEKALCLIGIMAVKYWGTHFILDINNLFATSEPPKYSNSNSPNLLLWFFCLIKSRMNRSGITQPFLNPDLIFFSNLPQIVCCRIIKKNQNKDLENSNLNILEFPMSRTSYISFTFHFVGLWVWHHF